MKLLVFFLAFVSAHCVLLASAASQWVTPSDFIRRNLKKYKYRSYMPFRKMERRIKMLEKLYPALVKVKVAGKSVEGRNIYLVIINEAIPRRSTRGLLQTGRQEGNPEHFGRGFDSHNLTKDSRFESRNRVPYTVRRPIVFPSRDAHGTRDTSQSVHIEEVVRNPEEFEDNTSTHDDVNEQNIEDEYRTGPEKQLQQPEILIEQQSVIFVDGGIHAREWASPAAAFYLIDQLLKTPLLISHLEWRIMPMVNPDGYVFSHKSNSTRFWRKNRARNKKKTCRGVDLNRNFDINWEDTDHVNYCSDAFSGTGPFSEPETSAIRDELQDVQLSLMAYVTIHTYGQFFLYPYGYSNSKKPRQWKMLESMADGMAQAIYDKYNNTYGVKQASFLGVASGGSDDWAYLEMGAPYSYTFEMQSKIESLSDYEINGFKLDPSKLPQAVDECWLAFKYMAERILQQRDLPGDCADCTYCTDCLPEK